MYFTYPLRSTMVARTTTPNKPPASFLSLARELRQAILFQAIHDSLDEFWKVENILRIGIATEFYIGYRYRLFLELTDVGHTTSSSLKQALANTNSAADLEWAENAIISDAEKYMRAGAECYFHAGRGLKKLSDRVLPAHAIGTVSEYRHLSPEEKEGLTFDDAAEKTV